MSLQSSSRTKRSWLTVPQPGLGGVGLLVLLTMCSLAAPLSLDMYTPAVPGMSAALGATTSEINLTLVGYFLFLAIGLLIFGPLSDKSGRRPVLIGGIVAYLAASVVCALSVNVWMLIVARVAQALGSGAMGAVCTAVVKDAVAADQRERILAVIQIMFVVGPAAAPLIGAGILAIADWRATFWTLAGIAAVELVLTLRFRETLPAQKRSTRSIPATLGRLVVVGRNPSFLLFLIVGSAFEIGYMAYVSVGSYIYVDTFGFSPFGFSLFFATGSLMCAVGPAFWVWHARHTTVKRFTTWAIILSAALGIGIATIGHANAFLFCGLILAFTFFDTAVKPYNVNILLLQQDGDTGSAAALANFGRTFIGALGMCLVMLPFPDFITAVGALMFAGMAIAGIAWVVLLRGGFTLRGATGFDDDGWKE